MAVVTPSSQGESVDVLAPEQADDDWAPTARRAAAADQVALLRRPSGAAAGNLTQHCDKRGATS